MAVSYGSGAGRENAMIVRSSMILASAFIAVFMLGKPLIAQETPPRIAPVDRRRIRRLPAG